MANYRLVFQFGGGVSVFTPHEDARLPEESMQDCLMRLAPRVVPEGMAWYIKTTKDLPPHRHFRNAWKLLGTDVTTHMPTAREIHRDKIRLARAPILARLDTAYLRADENSDHVSKVAIGAQKQLLRDMPQAAVIEAAATPQALIAAWPVELPNPYA